VEGSTLSQVPQPQTYRVTKEHIKISSYLWALARFLQVKQLKRVTRGEIIDALSYPNNVMEHIILNKGMEYGLLSRVRTGLYNVDLDMADTGSQDSTGICRCHKEHCKGQYLHEGG